MLEMMKRASSHPSQVDPRVRSQAGQDAWILLPQPLLLVGALRWDPAAHAIWIGLVALASVRAHPHICFDQLQFLSRGQGLSRLKAGHNLPLILVHALLSPLFFGRHVCSLHNSKTNYIYILSFTSRIRGRPLR